MDTTHQPSKALEILVKLAQVRFAFCFFAAERRRARVRRRFCFSDEAAASVSSALSALPPRFLWPTAGLPSLPAKRFFLFVGPGAYVQLRRFWEIPYSIWRPLTAILRFSWGFDFQEIAESKNELERGVYPRSTQKQVICLLVYLYFSSQKRP